MHFYRMSFFEVRVKYTLVLILFLNFWISILKKQKFGLFLFKFLNVFYSFPKDCISRHELILASHHKKWSNTTLEKHNIVHCVLLISPKIGLIQCLHCVSWEEIKLYLLFSYSL